MSFKEYKEKLRRLRKAGMDPSCPKCGSPMYWREGTELVLPEHREGAWECSNPPCWNMLPPGELAPDRIPEDWPEQKMAGMPPDPFHSPGRSCPKCGGGIASILDRQGEKVVRSFCQNCGTDYSPEELAKFWAQDMPNVPEIEHPVEDKTCPHCGSDRLIARAGQPMCLDCYWQPE